MVSSRVRAVRTSVKMKNLRVCRVTKTEMVTRSERRNRPKLQHK